MIKLFSQHWIALLVAFFIALIVVSPTLYSLGNAGQDNFKGIYPVFNDDEVHYLAMAKDAQEGGSGNVFLAGYDSDPRIQPTLADNIFASVANIFNMSIPQVFVVSDFVLVFIGVITLYYFFFLIFRSSVPAISFSTVFFFLFLFSFGRPVNPQFSFILLTLGLIFYYKSFFEQRKYLYTAFLAVCTGILVYVYPYFWTALFVLFFASTFFKAVANKKWPELKPIIIFLSIFSIIIIPYLINSFSASASPFYIETMQRYGVLNNHWPACYFNVLYLFLSSIIVLLCWKLLIKSESIFSISVLSSALALNWQNVITGKYLQFSSHYYMVTILFIFVVMAVLVNSLFVQKKGAIIKLANRLYLIGPLFLVLFILIVYDAKGEIVNGINNKLSQEQMMELQSYAPVMDWLRANTSDGSTVLALEHSIESYIPIYTDNKLFSYGYSVYYLVSDEELEDRWLIENLFLGTDINQDFIEVNNRFMGNKFIDAYQNQKIRNKLLGMINMGNADAPLLVPDEYSKKLLSKYEKIKNESPETLLNKYDLDYMLVDKDAPKSEFLKNLEKDFLRLEYSDDNWQIYKYVVVK